MVTDVKTPAECRYSCRSFLVNRKYRWNFLLKKGTASLRRVLARRGRLSQATARDARMYLGTCLLVSGSEKTWLQTRIKRSILNTVKNTPAESAFSGVP